MVKQKATRPTSTFPAIVPIRALSGSASFKSGKIRTITIISSIKYKVSFCFLSNGSGLEKVTPFPMPRLLLKPKRKIAIRIREKMMANPKIFISSTNEFGVPKVGSDS